MKAQCSAHAANTDARCMNRALPGSRYCLVHQSWGFNVVAVAASLVVGAILGVLTQAAFDRAVESPEHRQLRELRQQYADSQKEPEFEFLLNGKRLFADSIAVVETTKANISLEFAVHNIGTLSSRELLVTLRYPKAATHVNPGSAWQRHPPMFIGNADVEDETHLCLLAYRTSEMIPPGDALALPTIALTHPEKNSPLMPFVLQADSDRSNGALQRLHILFLHGLESLTIYEAEAGTDLRSYLERSVQQHLNATSESRAARLPLAR